MTTGQAGPPCDICGNQLAFISLMKLDDYSAVRSCLTCAPEFFATLAADMTAAAPPAGPRPGDPPAQVTAVTGPDGKDTGATTTGERVTDGAGHYIGHVDADGMVWYDPQPGPPPAARETPDVPPGVSPEDAREQASAFQRQMLADMGVTDPASTQCPGCGATVYTIPGSANFGCGWCRHVFSTPAPASAGAGTAAAGGPAAAADTAPPDGAPF